MKRKKFRQLVNVARNLKEQEILSKEERKEYLAIARDSRYLRNESLETPLRFIKTVKDYRICEFDDNAIVTEHSFMARYIPMSDFNGLGPVFMKTGFVTGLFAETLAQIQDSYGINIAPLHLFAGGCLATFLTGAAIFGGQQLSNIACGSSQTFHSRRDRIEKTAELEKYIQDPHNRPKPEFITTKEDKITYSKDKL